MDVAAVMNVPGRTCIFLHFLKVCLQSKEVEVVPLETFTNSLISIRSIRQKKNGELRVSLCLPVDFMP